MCRSILHSQASEGVIEGCNNEVWCYAGGAGRFRSHGVVRFLAVFLATTPQCSGPHAIGLIEIRDGSSQQIVRFGGQFRADCNGFCDMVRTKDCMWAAANNGYVQLQEKGSGGHICDK